MNISNLDTLVRGVNDGMQELCINDAITKPATDFNVFYRDDLMIGKLRSIGKTMMEDYCNDSAYKNHLKTENEIISDALDLLYYRHPNFGPVKTVHISDTSIYAAVDKESDKNTVKNLMNGKNSMKDIWVGSFFTNDSSIITPFISGMPCDKNKLEKYIRQKVCLTSLFKQNVCAVYQLYIDSYGIDVKESLIGAQFDFKAGIYYPASLITQYEIPRTNSDRNKHIHFVDRYML